MVWEIIIKVWDCLETGNCSATEMFKPLGSSPTWSQNLSIMREKMESLVYLLHYTYDSVVIH